MLINRQLAFELHGKTDVQFAESGLNVTLCMPMDALREPTGEPADAE
jgi:hypothetical protein